MINLRDDLFTRTDKGYQLKPPYRVKISPEILRKFYSRHYNQRKERGGLMIAKTPIHGRDFIIHKIKPIRNISHRPSQEYYPREDRFNELLEKYLENPFENVPFLYHTHPVKIGIPNNYNKWINMNIRQEISDQDFEPSPIWSKDLKADFISPQLLFTKSIYGWTVIWCYGSGTDLPIQDYSKTSFGVRNVESFTRVITDLLKPRIAVFKEKSLVEKVLLGLGITMASLGGYFLAKEYMPDLSKQIIWVMVAYSQGPLTYQNNTNPVFLQNIAQEAIINIVVKYSEIGF